MNDSNRSIISHIAPVTGWVVGIVIFFRYTLLSGFSQVTGDPADGQLIYSIHEHWYRVLQGLEGWHDLFFFYPLDNVLGYSDTFLGPGIIYVFFRLLGLDPFLSGQFVLFILATIGFWGMFLWLNRFRGVSVPVASFVAFLFVIASPMFMASRNSHLQLLSIWQFPIGLLLLESAIRSWNTKDGRLWFWILLFSTWFGLLTYSTFYAAYFFGLLLLLAAIGMVIYLGPRRCLSGVITLKPALLHLGPGLIILAAFAGLFLVTYLPVRMEMGGRPFETVLQHLPSPQDLVNHSTTNLVWGNLLEDYPPYEGPHRWEKELGFPLLTFVAGCCLALLALLKWRRSAFPLWIAAFVFVSGTALFVRIGEFTLWAIPYHLIPASEGLRAVFRFNLALLIPCLLLLAMGLEWARSSNLRWKPFLLLLPAILIGLEQIQTAGNATLSRTDKLALIHGAAAPPKDADAFYAVGTQDTAPNKDVPHNTAIYLAQAWNLPTMNGRSGFFPKGWILYPMEPEGAKERVASWAHKRQYDGTVYLFNLETGQWSEKFEYAPIPMPRLDGLNLVEFPAVFEEPWGYGWSGLEPWGIWSDSHEAGFRFEEGAFPDGIRFLHLKATGFVHEESPHREVDIIINDEWIQSVRFATSRSHVEWYMDLGKNFGKVTSLEFLIHDPTSPQSVGVAPDPRQLGIGIIKLELSASRLGP